MKILALDVGKSKSVAYLSDRETGEVEFRTVRTRPSEIAALLAKVRPDQVVFEIGPMAGWLHDLATAAGVEVLVANPTHEGWKWRNVKRKTDRLDAVKLADLALVGRLPTVHLPVKAVREQRALIRFRTRLVEHRTEVKNRIRAILDRQGRSMPAGAKAWTHAGLATLEAEARAADAVGPEELWRLELGVGLRMLAEVEAHVAEVESKLDVLGQAHPEVQRLRTIPGVGPRLAETLVAVIDGAGRFRRGRQVASYFGLVPRQFQSGQMDRQGRITKQGDRLVRKLLVEVSWMGLRYNPALRAIFERVCRGSPKRRKIAIVAVARHLVVMAWAMLRDGTTWRPPRPAEPDTAHGDTQGRPSRPAPSRGVRGRSRRA
jgi:transposase